MAKPIKRNIWSNIDVFGLINGISVWDSQYRNLRYVRKPFETGLEIRDKIFRNLDNPGGVTKQGLLNGLSNEIGLDTYNVKENKIFELTYNPVPIGNESDQDISGYFRPKGTDTWYPLIPQVWSTNYENAKILKRGFIVWQQDRYTNISGIKNFQYSNLVEILGEYPNDTEFKFIYGVYSFDEDNNRSIINFTDLNDVNDINDNRFTYNTIDDFDLDNNVVVYTLDDIPSSLRNKYYNKNGEATKLLHTLKEDFIDQKYKHKWNQLRDKTVIWDINKFYGSGEIPHFYDAEIPINHAWCGLNYTGFIGGIESVSTALYPEEIVESGEFQNWFLKIYPGRFYIDGVPFYYFENPKKENITFVDNVASIPSGLTRGMYTIITCSGYYDDYCNYDRDEYLSGVYEDYEYPAGQDADSIWFHIYRRKPYLVSDMGYEITLQEGEYQIDFDNNRIISNGVPSGATIVWDQTLNPTGTLLQYDLNPLNDKNLSFEKFFLYMSLDVNRG